MEKYTNGRQASGNFVNLYGKRSMQQVKRYDDLIRRFKKQFNTTYCYLASSSGRVELIGNHTDHNGGKVVGCTIDLDIVAAFLPNDRNQVTIIGNNYRDIVVDIADIDNIESGSAGMVKGVLAGLRNRGRNIGGFDAIIHSTLPSGAGISSSAAFQLLTGAIENGLYNNGEISPRLLAEVGQYAENVYFNKPCGLLDQGVIAVGGVVGIDFKDGFSEYKMGTDLMDLNLVVVDTGKSHASLTEHYAAIPAEMKAVANYFGKQRLIEVDELEFRENYQNVIKEIGERPALRAKHFFEENRRVDKVGEALKDGDKQKLLEAVTQSGDSSIYQLQNCAVGDDTTVADAVLYVRNVCPSCASRVHGGGFAGTILAVVDNKEVKTFATELENHFGKDNVHILKVRKLGATVL